MQIGKVVRLMLIRQIIIVFIGLCAGFVVAGGLYSFIAMVGVLTRLATRTKTANRVMLYEDCVTFGAGIGNCVSMMNLHVRLGPILVAAYGFFAGIFIGCLAIALSEVLNVIPTFARRTKLKVGLSGILLMMSLGKLIGTIFQLVYMSGK